VSGGREREEEGVVGVGGGVDYEGRNVVFFLYVSIFIDKESLHKLIRI